MLTFIDTDVTFGKVFKRKTVIMRVYDGDALYGRIYLVFPEGKPMTQVNAAYQFYPEGTDNPSPMFNTLGGCKRHVSTLALNT